MAGSVPAGRAHVEIALRDQLSGGLKRTAARLRGFSRSVGAIGGTLLAGAGALAAPFLPAIAKASDFQEVMSKFNTVFGDQAGTVQQWGDDFAGQVGRSKKQIAEFMAGSQDLFVPLGFDAGTATELSKTLTGLSVDLASFNNMQDADTLRDLHAALTGSGEVMKKYGVIVSEAAVKQELLNRGLDPKTASDQEKVQSRLNIILAGTTAAQGDALRTAGSYANQMKRLRATLDDTQVALGTAILPALTAFAARASTVIQMVGAWIQANPQIVQGVAALAVGLGAAGALLVTVGGAGFALSTILTGLSTLVGVVGAAFGLLVSPIGLAVAAIVGLIAAGIAWTGSWSTIVDFFTSTLGAMGNALANGNLALAGEILWSSLKLAFAQGTIDIRKAWIETWHGLGAILDGVVTGLRSAWAGLTNWIADSLLAVIGYLQDIGAWLAEVVGIKVETIDIEGIRRTLDEDSGRGQDKLATDKSKRDDARGEQLQKDLAATEARLAELQASRGASIAEAGGATFTGRGELLDQLRGFLDAAQPAAAEAGGGLVLPGATASGGVNAAAKVSGTFSSAAAGLLGGNARSAGERTAKAAEKTASEVRELRKEIRTGGGLVYGA